MLPIDTTVVERLNQQITEKIAHHGRAFVVAPHPTEPGIILSAYTVGLTDRSWPELILTAEIPTELVQPLFESILAGWEIAGEPLLGYLDDLAMEWGEMYLRQVNPELAAEKYAPLLKERYPDMTRVRVVQILLPDIHERMTFHPDYNHYLNPQDIIDPVM